jgi:hypothetical protein
MIPVRPANRHIADKGSALVQGFVVKRAVLCLGIVGTLVTCAVGVNMAHTRGVFWSRVNVVFLLPRSTLNPNVLQASADSLITLAGAVGKMVSDPESSIKVVSDSVTLPGEGIKHGYTVRLPNSGGQWANNYTEPLLDVQAVGTTAAEVQSTMTSVVQSIDARLSEMQQAARVDEFNLVTTRLSPPTPPLYFVRGSRVRAVAATLLLGFGMTVATVVTLSRVLRRRRYQLRPPPSL